MATVPHYTSFQFNTMYGCKNKNMEAIFLECTLYNKGNKMRSTQLVYVTALMWQHVSISKGHLQAGGVTYIKEICIQL